MIDLPSRLDCFVIFPNTAYFINDMLLISIVPYLGRSCVFQYEDHGGQDFGTCYRMRLSLTNLRDR